MRKFMNHDEIIKFSNERVLRMWIKDDENRLKEEVRVIEEELEQQKHNK